LASRASSAGRAIARTGSLAAVLGIAGGYVVFYGVFPLTGIPAASEASVLFMIGLLSLTAILVGLATENLREMIFQSFFALFLSGAVASAMALSPIFVGVVFVAPDSVLFILFQYGFVLFVLSFVVDLLGTSVGLALREHYFFRGRRGPRRAQA
jgi:hypothetical protein